MYNLVSLIGPAPSEVPFEVLRERVEKERNRVRAAITDWRNGVGLKPVKEKKLAKEKKTSKTKAILNEYEQIQAMMKTIGAQL
jgi:hypothetical protein